MTRLYLVDDHLIMREGLRVLLQAWGHTVVGESADLTSALADIQRLKPAVVLLDLHLEGRSGLELLAAMRQRKLDTRCVVLTMLAQPRMVAEALRMGAQAYVLKGSAGRELACAIEAAAMNRRYLGTGVAELAEQSGTQGDQPTPLETLSPRERQIITMVVKGMSSVRIGAQLHLSPKTVDTYRSRLMGKLKVHDVPSLVRLAIHHKLLEQEEQ
jgi:DNA-binding NarL/FixJ family response regulator